MSVIPVLGGRGRRIRNLRLVKARDCGEKKKKNKNRVECGGARL